MPSAQFLLHVLFLEKFWEMFLEETIKVKKQITNYTVQPGDTIQSIATSYNISVNTILWANGLKNGSPIKVGQDLTILPVDGVLHVVKSGDTMSAIAQKYKANSEDIISFNSLANQDDIYIGDILLVPGGVMPKTASPIINNNQIPLARQLFYFSDGRNNYPGFALLQCH